MRATVVPRPAIVNDGNAADGSHFLYISRVFVAIDLGNRNAIPHLWLGPFGGGKGQ
jgi:hypothetical protein